MFRKGSYLVTILMIWVLFSSSCKKENEYNHRFFGIPNVRTGLSSDDCKPFCVGDDCFFSTPFSQARLAELRTWTLSDTIAELSYNPYDTLMNYNSDGVCAVVVDDLAQKIYHLETYNSPEDALADGAILTHFDACGKCSSLQDFTVYAENIDIGYDVRNCILSNFNAPFEDLVACIEGLGFTKPCAQIWAHNSKNTQQECLVVCLSDTLYNQPDGSLSDCILCDEEKSGPIFKAVAGRTRRNTGIASSICRPCNEVQFVEHNYP